MNAYPKVTIRVAILLLAIVSLVIGGDTALAQGRGKGGKKGGFSQGGSKMRAPGRGKVKVKMKVKEKGLDDDGGKVKSTVRGPVRGSGPKHVAKPKAKFAHPERIRRHRGR